MLLCRLLIFFATVSPALVTSALWAQAPTLSGLAAKGLNVELKSPTFHDGALETDQGGVIRGKDLYLQAQKIRYIRRQEGGTDVHRIEAEGTLFLRFKDRAYIGDRIEFDLDSQTGVIYNVLTESGPWFVGGERLILKPDGASIIYDCVVSSNENDESDWNIQANEVNLTKNGTLRAKNVHFMMFKKPVFWWPSYTKNLKKDTRSPIKYRFRYFGKHGPRVGLSYTFGVGDNWENRILLDISLTRGAGGGFETEYKNPDKKEERFSAFNYYAYDIGTTDSNLKNRYRYQGKYTNSYFDDTVHFRASYDKLSDFDFPSDFTSRGLDSGRAGATEAKWSKHHSEWIASVNTKVRINPFQTVKQTLPLFEYTMRPQTLGNSGIVLDNRLSAGYLDYRYAHHTHHLHDFNSTRMDVNQKIFRQFQSQGIIVTPYLGYRAIGYGNSPQHDSKLLAIANAGFEAHTRFRRRENGIQQVVEPYFQYDYVTQPSVEPDHHYLFDLQDGLYRQNVLRFGTRQFLSYNKSEGFLSQLNSDLYARAFFNTPTVGQTIPRIYFDNSWKATPYTTYGVNMAWDAKHNDLGFINCKSAITLSDDVALALEYRHRNRYTWRKVDPENFMLDTFRDEHSLLHSQVSDRRDTFLTHLFFRLSPQVALELKSRHGWARRFAPSYNEYECNVITLFRGAFQVTFNFQHREYENRYAVYFSLGAKPSSSPPTFRKIGHGNYDMP